MPLRALDPEYKGEAFVHLYPFLLCFINIFTENNYRLFHL